jgi:hypothetical protein
VTDFGIAQGGHVGPPPARRAWGAAVAVVGALVAAVPLLLAWRPSPAGAPPGGSSTAGRTAVAVPAVVGFDQGDALRRLLAVGLAAGTTVAGGGDGNDDHGDRDD